MFSKKLQKYRRIFLVFLFTTFIISVPSLISLLGKAVFPPIIFPRINEISQTLFDNPIQWILASIFTLFLSIIAGVLSVLIGIIIGSIIAFFHETLGFLEIESRLLWSIPLIAISVYLNLLLGSGWLYVITLGLFLGFYPILEFTYRKCTEESEGIEALAASFGLNRYKEFRYLRIPNVIKNIADPLSKSLPLVFIGITMGEYMIGRVVDFTPGLGGYLRQAQNNVSYPDLWLSIILMAILVLSSGLCFESKYVQNALSRIKL